MVCQSIICILGHNPTYFVPDGLSLVEQIFLIATRTHLNWCIEVIRVAVAVDERVNFICKGDMTTSTGSIGGNHFENNVLRFMDEAEVPFTNNMGENYLCMTKVQKETSESVRPIEGG